MTISRTSYLFPFQPFPVSFAKEFFTIVLTKAVFTFFFLALYLFCFPVRSISLSNVRCMAMSPAALHPSFLPYAFASLALGLCFCPFVARLGGMTASTPEASLDTDRLRVLVGFSAICLTELVIMSRITPKRAWQSSRPRSKKTC